jgi:uncharacterized protein YggU (UPF0235/DUF167 family)
VRVAVRLQPRAARDAIDGIVGGADGRPVLAARVRAVPEQGRANAALVRLLAAAWGVPAGSIAVVGGGRSRSKLIEVAGDPPVLLARLEAWRAERGEGR